MAQPQRNSQNKNEQPNPGQVRNVKTSLNDDFKYIDDSASPYAGQVASKNQDLYRAPTNVQYSQQAYKENVLGPVGITNKQSSKAKVANDNTYQEEVPDRAQAYRERVRQKARERLAGKTLPSTLSLAKTQVARTKATVINVSALSWAGTLWLVQLILGVVYIVTLGIVAGIDGITSSSGGILATAAKWALGLVDIVAKFINLDFAAAAMGIFTIFYILTMVIGLVTLLILYTQYELGGLRPLSGKALGMKQGALLLAVLGYCIPFVNLLPFVGVCMFTVWLHPR